MPAVFWLALVIGYAAGVAGALLFLPNRAIEPLFGTIVLVSALVVAGIGGLMLLTRSGRERGGEAVAPAPEAPFVATGGPLREESGRDLPTAGPVSQDELSAALREGGVDVFLQPLFHRPPRRVACHLALARLRGADGAHVEPPRFRTMATRSGLLALLDRVFIVRCTRAIRQADARDQEIRLFCGIAPDSLQDAAFLAEIEHFLAEHGELADRLVLEFDRVRLGRPGEQTLVHLRRMGLRACLKRLTPAVIDGQALRRRGYSYVRLEGERYASPADSRELTPELAPLHRALEDGGLALLVDQAGGRARPVEILDHPLQGGRPPAGAGPSPA